MLTPKLIVTNAGLDIANHATPTGPWINIKKFKIYSEANYNYDKNTVEQRGDFLYGDTPLSYRNIGDNTLDIVCMIPAEAGPFEYGSIGLYVEDEDNNDVLFAIAVYDRPQTKYSSLGSNVASSAVFHCLLKLTQSTAVFRIDTLMPTPIQEVDYWHEVLPPSRSANEYPLLLVREPDPFGRTSLLHISDDEYWTIGTTYPIFQEMEVKNATRNWIDVDVNESGLVSQDLTDEAGQYVLEVRAQGIFRYVTQVTQQGLSTYRFHLSVELVEIPAVGSSLRLHRNDGFRGYYEVPLSLREGNLLQQAEDGLYYGDQAPDDIANLYIDAVNGDDSNAGTRTAPLKTIKEAVDRGPGGVVRSLFLYEGQVHYVSAEDPAVLRGGRWSIYPYGPVTDSLPPVPGDTKYAQTACIELNTRIQGTEYVSRTDSAGGSYQHAVAMSPQQGAEVTAVGITFVAGSPNSSGHPLSSARGTFAHYNHSWHYRFRWCRFVLPTSQSFLIGPAHVNSTLVFLGGGNPILSGQGKLISTVSEPLSVQLSALTGSGVIGTPGRTLVDYLPSNIKVSAYNLYNFKSDLDPSFLAPPSGDGGTWSAVSRGNLVNYTNNTANYVAISVYGPYTAKASTGAQIWIDGLLVNQNALRDGSMGVVTSIIPPGSIYRIRVMRESSNVGFSTRLLPLPS